MSSPDGERIPADPAGARATFLIRVIVANHSEETSFDGCDQVLPEGPEKMRDKRLDFCPL